MSSDLSLEQAKAIYDNARRVRSEALKAISPLAQAVLDAEIVYHKIVAEQVLVPYSSIAFSGWDCPTSPIGTCIYNREQDPSMDYCIFCEDPLERK